MALIEKYDPARGQTRTVLSIFGPDVEPVEPTRKNSRPMAQIWRN